jgi:hypothetical protein
MLLDPVDNDDDWLGDCKGFCVEAISRGAGMGFEPGAGAISGREEVEEPGRDCEGWIGDGFGKAEFPDVGVGGEPALREPLRGVGFKAGLSWFVTLIEGFPLPAVGDVVLLLLPLDCGLPAALLSKLPDGLPSLGDTLST